MSRSPMMIRINVYHWSERLGCRIKSVLAEYGSKAEARWIMEAAFNIKIDPNDKLQTALVSTRQIRKLMKWVHDRIHLRKPLQYILGNVQFSETGLELKAQNPILIPRPETEFMCSWIIEQVRQSSKSAQIKILDIGTGSGCIALSLASAIPNCMVIGIDANIEAINLAQQNLQAQQNREELETRVEFRYLEADSDALFKEKFDLIVSNPPYIPVHQWGKLQPEIRCWEDPLALVASESGLGVYKGIAEFISRNSLLLTDSSADFPCVVFEFGDEFQVVSLDWLLSNKLKMNKVTVHQDQYGAPRWIAGWSDTLK